MWWIVGAVGPATLAISALAGCSKDRETVHRPKPGSKTARKGGSSKSSKRVPKKGSQSSRSGRSKRSKRSTGSKSAAARSGKSQGKSASRKGKSSKSGKTGAKDTSLRSQKTQKSVKSAKDKKEKSEKSSKSKKSLKTADFSKKSSKSKSSKKDKKSEKEKNAGDKLGAAAPVSTVDLTMEPAELHWKATGGLQKIQLSNNSTEKRAIKIKCSDNLLYRVNPVYSFVNPGETVKIDVLRQNGGSKIDKMVMVTTKAEGDNPQQCFSKGADPAHPNEMLVLPLLVSSE